MERVAPQSTQQLRPPGPPPGAGSRRAQTRRVRHARWRALRLLLSYRIYITGLSYRIYITGLSLCSCLPKVESRTPLCRAGYGRSDPALAACAWPGAHSTRSLTSPTGSASTRAPTSPARRPGRVKRARPLAARVSSLIGRPVHYHRSKHRTDNRSRRACDSTALSRVPWARRGPTKSWRDPGVL